MAKDIKAYQKTSLVYMPMLSLISNLLCGMENSLHNAHNIILYLEQSGFAQLFEGKISSWVESRSMQTWEKHEKMCLTWCTYKTCVQSRQFPISVQIRCLWELIFLSLHFCFSHFLHKWFFHASHLKHCNKHWFRYSMDILLIVTCNFWSTSNDDDSIQTLSCLLCPHLE